MAKYVRKLKPEFQPKPKPLDELKVGDLRLLCEEADLPSGGTKEELIKRLRLFQEDKHVLPVVYTTSEPKNPKTPKLFFIGVHKNDEKSLHKVKKLAEARFHHYASDYFYFLTQTRIKL